ncbi:hypothetical protein [Methanocaldococcus infernus]
MENKTFYWTGHPFVDAGLSAILLLNNKQNLAMKVLTSFQIMKAFFGVGFYEMELSELAKSLLIFDEIHVYEPNIIGIILGMLDILVNGY